MFISELKNSPVKRTLILNLNLLLQRLELKLQIALLGVHSKMAVSVNFS